LLISVVAKATPLLNQLLKLRVRSWGGEKMSWREYRKEVEDGYASLFWHGDFRDCPDISEEAKQEAYRDYTFWHGTDNVDPEIIEEYGR